MKRVITTILVCLPLALAADEAALLSILMPPDAVQFDRGAAMEEIRQSERLCGAGKQLTRQAAVACRETLQSVTAECTQELKVQIRRSFGRIEPSDRQRYQDTYRACVDAKNIKRASIN